MADREAAACVIRRPGVAVGGIAHNPAFMMSMPHNANAEPQDSPEAIARDVTMVSRLNAVPSSLQVVCQCAGMGFAAVARVTESTWTACAVRDEISVGFAPGSHFAIDRRPFPIGAPQIRETFRWFAESIAGLMEDERRHLNLTIEVSNLGLPIPQEDPDRIFELYARESHGRGLRQGL